jgi:2-polyprenyl-3-methyl-5-hydroxy-6-metoxy-1,4-benzoquinol methylase
MYIISENQRKHTSSNPLQKLLIMRFHEKIFSYINKLSITNLLDVGCGEGFVMKELIKQNKKISIFGLDRNYHSLSWGRNHIIHNEPVLCSNAMLLPLEDNTQQMVICLEVLEHLDDPKSCLNELIRVASQYILISVLNEPFFRIANFLRGKNLSRLGNDIEHVNLFTAKKLNALIPTNRVKIIEHSFIFPWQIILGQKIMRN